MNRREALFEKLPEKRSLFSRTVATRLTVARPRYNAVGAASVMRELVDAVAYLHEMGIAHLDLKPENVLLKSDETDACDVRLVDFGSARFVGRDRIGGADSAAVGGGLRPADANALADAKREGKPQGPAGATPAYAAPEVLRGETFDESADVWSLGVILYLLLTGTHPFDSGNDADDGEVTRRVLAGAEAAGAFDGPEWARVPGGVKPLVRKLLSADAASRPSATEVLAHPWLADPQTFSRGGTGDPAGDKAAAEAAVEGLREFHRGRRRFKAMLLAVMIGYADETLTRDRGSGTEQLGSRRAAMKVFDADDDGVVTASDVRRVARLLGERLSDREANEMLRAVARRDDPMPGQRKKTGVTETGIFTERLRHMLPPLYPAHRLDRGDLVFSAGETDPAFYILLSGDVLISHSFLLRPRSGFSIGRDRTAGRELSLGLHRLQKGESFGETELLEARARAGKGCEIPNFKGSYLGRFPLVLADFWTSDHLSERPRT